MYCIIIYSTDNTCTSCADGGCQLCSQSICNQYRKKEVRTHTALYKLQYKVHIL